MTSNQRLRLNSIPLAASEKAILTIKVLVAVQQTKTNKHHP
jgi:hypothetical protein